MRRTKSVLVVAGGLIALAACGSSGGSSSSGGGAYGGGGSSSTTAAAKAAAKGGPVTDITAKDFAFTPTAPNLAADGATIHVANTGSVKHNLTVEGLKVNKDLPPGSAFDVNVNAKPGTYQFHCEYHPTTMKGTITVP
jgi:plastocyanin